MSTPFAKRLVWVAVSIGAASGSIAAAGPPVGGPAPPHRPLPQAVCAGGWTASPALLALVRNKYVCTSNATLGGAGGLNAVCASNAGFNPTPTFTQKPNGQVVAGPTITIQHGHGVYTCMNTGTQAVSLVPR